MKPRDVKSIKVVSKEDPELKIHLHCDARNAPEDSTKIRIGDTVIRQFEYSENMQRGQTFQWFPQGVRCNGEGYSASNLPGFLTGLGLKEVKQNASENTYGIYWEESDKVGSLDLGYFKFCTKGTNVNLFGETPIYKFRFVYSMENPDAYMFATDVYPYGGFLEAYDLSAFKPAS